MKVIDGVKYYSSGEFAAMAHITKKTVRFYDAKGILKPSYVNENGNRYYTEQDFARLQQILMFKYLGFSLKEIKEILVDTVDVPYLCNVLDIQKNLMKNQIEEMQTVESALEVTQAHLVEEKGIDWDQMMGLIHLTGIEKSLKDQYTNASNLSDRIRLHKECSTATEGWFPFLYRISDIREGQRILEIGCGNGQIWVENKNRLPKSISITCSDLSEGMLRDARRAVGPDDKRFSWNCFDASEIPYEDESFDLVIANHVLFYLEDIDRGLKEIYRVLKPGGRLICSTYGSNHLKEINELCSTFDDRIHLTGSHLYEKFGRENGKEILEKRFSKAEWIPFQDSLEVNNPELLDAYVLSCHGNQRQYLLNRYREFKDYTARKCSPSFHVTKDAGAFIAEKQVVKSA